jgi:hypothetical protein
MAVERNFFADCRPQAEIVGAKKTDCENLVAAEGDFMTTQKQNLAPPSTRRREVS